MGFEYSAPVRLASGQQRLLGAALVASGYEMVGDSACGALRLRFPGVRSSNWASDADIHFDEAILVVIHGGTGEQRSQLLRRVEAWLLKLGQPFRLEEL